MAGQSLTNDTAFIFPWAGRFELFYYSASSGTGKLTEAPDGTNYFDVADTNKSASGSVLIDVGALDSLKYKVQLTGDMLMWYAPVTQNSFGA